MRRPFVVLAAASIAALTTFGTVSAASSGKTVRIIGDESFIPDQSFTESFRFEQRTTTVHSGDTVTWHNFTTDPHTMSVVAPTDVPKTVAQVMNCSVCGPFLGGHAPNAGPNGPMPPFVFFLDNLAPSTPPAKLDSVGDSILVAPSGATFPTTTGGTITDTVSALITAPAGTTLNYICAIHPWMQAKIKVVGEHDND